MLTGNDIDELVEILDCVRKPYIEGPAAEINYMRWNIPCMNRTDTSDRSLRLRQLNHLRKRLRALQQQMIEQERERRGLNQPVATPERPQ